MIPRSSCGGAFREIAGVFRVIGKVLRGTNAARLLYYLYGPGKANEHTDPHLVAGFSDPADLEPERRPGGSRNFRRLAGLLAQPLAALAGPGYARPVWHCAVRAAPGEARSAPPRGTGCCRTRSGPRSRPVSWTGPGSPRR